MNLFEIFLFMLKNYDDEEWINRLKYEKNILYYSTMW